MKFNDILKKTDSKKNPPLKGNYSCVLIGGFDGSKYLVVHLP
jgi:hypothetical protein